MPNDVDELMSRIDEINHLTPPLSAENIDDLIAYHRRARALKAAGVKPTRAKRDLAEVMGAILPKKAQPTVPAPAIFKLKF